MKTKGKTKWVLADVTVVSMSVNVTKKEVDEKGKRTGDTSFVHVNLNREDIPASVRQQIKKLVTRLVK